MILRLIKKNTIYKRWHRMSHTSCAIMYTSESNKNRTTKAVGLNWSAAFLLGDYMLKACSRCGRVHEYGQCSISAIPYNRKKIANDITRFRSSRAWQRKRKTILERDAYLCKLCLYNNRLNSKGLEVHHIIAIKKNAELKLDDRNLITLCRDCHELVEDDSSYQSLLTRLASIPPGKII